MKHRRGEKENNHSRLLSLIAKIAFIWCLVIFTAGYVTSNTTAEFNDKVLISDQGSIGVWEEEPEKLPPEDSSKWDKHSLQFVSKPTQNLTDCGPVVIDAKLKNTSDMAMTETLSYDVYYVENGNPKNKHGEKLELPDNEGIIPALKAEESILLTFTANEAGSYMFRVEYPGEEGIWSEKIMVKCKMKNQTKSNENIEEEQDELVEKQHDPNETEGKESAGEKQQVNEQPPIKNEEVVETQEEDMSKSEAQDPNMNTSGNESGAGK